MEGKFEIRNQKFEELEESRGTTDRHGWTQILWRAISRGAAD
jgi:hypothetical protein